MYSFFILRIAIKIRSLKNLYRSLKYDRFGDYVFQNRLCQVFCVGAALVSRDTVSGAVFDPQFKMPIIYPCRFVGKGEDMHFSI